jgi:hypothetical protein
MYRRQGRFDTLGIGSGGDFPAAKTGVTGTYTDPSGNSVASDVAVGDFITFIYPGQKCYRWRITAVSAAGATLTVNLIPDGETTDFPVTFITQPIPGGSHVLHGAIAAGGAGYVPSFTSLQISEVLVGAVASENALEAGSGGGGGSLTADQTEFLGFANSGIPSGNSGSMSLVLGPAGGNIIDSTVSGGQLVISGAWAAYPNRLVGDTDLRGILFGYDNLVDEAIASGCLLTHHSVIERTSAQAHSLIVGGGGHRVLEHGSFSGIFDGQQCTVNGSLIAGSIDCSIGMSTESAVQSITSTVPASIPVGGPQPGFLVNVASTAAFGVSSTGTATAGAASTLTDSGKTWTVNQWVDSEIRITSGTGAGQKRMITSNTATAVTVSKPWTVTPNATSVYSIGDITQAYCLSRTTNAAHPTPFFVPFTVRVNSATQLELMSNAPVDWFNEPDLTTGNTIAALTIILNNNQQCAIICSNDCHITGNNSQTIGSSIIGGVGCLIANSANNPEISFPGHATVIGGRSSNAQAPYQIAFGQGAKPHNSGQWTRSYGSFAADGDCQFSSWITRAVTTDGNIVNTLIPFGLNGVIGYHYNLRSNRVYGVRARVTAVSTTGASAARYILDALVKVDAVGATSILAQTKSAIFETNAAWDVVMNVYSAAALGGQWDALDNGEMHFTVTGEAGLTVRWSIHVEVDEIAYA